jgi:hypothetical protein
MITARAMAISAELLLWFGVSAGSAATLEQNSSVQFAVTDPRTGITESLSSHLVLKIRGSVDAQGRRSGWDIAVIDRRLGDYPNFLYDCLCGHGPRPNDLWPGTFARGSIRRSEFCRCMVIPLRFAWPVRTAELTATPLQTHTLPRE